MQVPSSPVTVRSDRLVLRPFADADLPQLAVAFADPAVARWNPGPVPPGTPQTWAAGRNDWSDGGHASWAVGDLDGALLGSISLHRIDADQLDSEVGYWIGPWARGRGLAAEALRVATRFAFAELGLHRVYLHHAVENAASCGVARAAGFRHEGTLLQSYRYPDGEYHDEHLHACLPDDLS